MLIKDRIRDFRRVPANTLRPSPWNWRTHPQAQRDALKGILAEIGFAGAELARELPDGSLELIDGHARAEEMGANEVPVLVTDLTEAEARKLLAVYDPISAMAEANKDSLDKLLREVSTDNEALQGLLAGLATDNGIALNGAADAPEDPGPQIDRAAELQAKWQTAPGQLWEIPSKATPGRCHRLLCGDSTKVEDVARVMGGEKPFIMVTDPPYGVEYEAGWRDGVVGEFGHGARVKGAVANDDTVDWTPSYRLFLGDVAYIWHASFFTVDVGINLREAGFKIRASIIWRKQHFAISQGHYHWQHEPCWYGVRKGATARWCGDRTQSTVWDIASLNPAGRTEERVSHATQKPLECMARPIRNHGTQGDLVYDPFLGSGTTIVAAEQTGRLCHAVEISPAYVAVALERLTGLSLEPRLLQ